MAKQKKDNETVSSGDLESADLRTLSSEQVKSLSADQVRGLTPEQFNSLSNEQLLALSPEQQAALSPDQRTRLTAAQSGTPSSEEKKEALNPQEVNLAPGYSAAADPGPGERLHEKIPHYAPGAAPPAGTTRYNAPVGKGATDVRVPPENVSVTTNQDPASGPTSAQRAQDASQNAGQDAAKKQPDPNTISATATPADVGLPRPELIAGRNPLPEEDPTPSIVPIPPPGPRRVA